MAANKFRIVKNNAPGVFSPYHIEKKGWYFWSPVVKPDGSDFEGSTERFQTLQDAIAYIQNWTKHQTPPVKGHTVVWTDDNMAEA